MDWNSSTALDALRSSDLLELGMAANQVRHDLHPEPVVTYELCGRPTSLEEAISEAIPRNGGAVNLEQVGGIGDNSLDVLEARLKEMREKFPEVAFQHLPISRMTTTAGDVVALADALPRLQESGLRSISANFNPASSSLSHGELTCVLNAAATCGLLASVFITIGNSESLEHRIGTLEVLRSIQEDTHSIQVVGLRVHHAASPEARREEEATAVDYLKTLAVARIFLNNVEHLQTGWSVMGPKVLELALRFGANDAGTIAWSQTGTPGPSHHGGESELRRIIRDAGFRPVERDALFRQSLLR